MRVSETWLREWVNPSHSIEEIGHLLTMAGVELDGIEPAAADFNDVLIGKIESIEKHPDADKLNVCQVNVGAGETLQIVCGAANARADLLVPVAMIGAQLPTGDGGQFKIKQSKLRGVESFGMICSTEELGIEASADGIMELPADAPIGDSIRDYLQLDDVIMDIDLTPNRADCLSIAGVAREVGVLCQTDVNPVTVDDVPASLSEQKGVSIEADDLCKRYACRIIKSVNTTAETPLWMQEKLRRAGVACISPVVDVTNYVMMELGQPMHAFDLAKVSGDIVVRRATKGESLELLDGKTVELNDDTMVIADQQQALALAGIMGGMGSSVTDATQDILLESAYFVPEKIMGKARQYGTQTDSSYRFERGVSASVQTQALARATQLIVELCGGEVGTVNDVVADASIFDKPVIEFSNSEISRHLGVSLDKPRCTDIFTRLECEVTETEAGWQITPPLFRFDLNESIDFVEEIARIYGYDNIPANAQPVPIRDVYDSEKITPESSLVNVLVARDYNEVISYSFVPPKMESMLAPSTQTIRLSNPISEDLSVMRSTLWSGLLQVLEHNIKRQQNRIRIFESGLNFIMQGDELTQNKKMAGLICGLRQPEIWNQSDDKVDFYDIKADVEALLEAACVQGVEFRAVSDNAMLHPGQGAELVHQGKVIGVLGAVHPSICKNMGIKAKVFGFEIDLAAIVEREIPHYQAYSNLPSMRRDLALVADESIDFAQITNTIAENDIKTLVDVRLFDVYSGDGIGEQKRSFGLGLTFADTQRTLEDAEINQAIEQLLDALQTSLGVEQRA